MTEHDPFNKPETAHPRAQELMIETLFWDCTYEAAPFGSDEGSDAYYEWREWREENSSAKLIECFNWICDGQLQNYTISLTTDEQVTLDIESPENAFLSDHFDIFTLDVTIIATGLSQLMDEGEIDKDAKPYMQVAIERQRNPKLGYFDNSTLNAVARVVAAA